jgi:hypothetical protein
MNMREKPIKSNLYFDLIEAMALPNCAVCRRVDVAARQYVDSFFYESITTVARRTEIRDARGFCSVHGAMVSGHNRMLGVAIIHHDVLTNILRDFGSDASRSRLDPLASRMKTAIKNALRPKRECPLCEFERHHERILLETLIHHLDDDAMRNAFENSSGVCTPHVAIAMDMKDLRIEALRSFVEIERRILERLNAQLDDFIHKSNGSYDFVAMGDESDAPLRAVRLISGRVFGRRA